ncbi:universal stress protein [Antarcticibacterium flavum]|uniref:Universal stress protein n=1 Tax=Antarcticibacterium flavum TaxID=2058175 RepID=A0A5B7X1S9_9FLAO|nr:MULTISPECIES: universal stress protein [Antarcticibacterium]MCM4158710.1 universal stress protein [Antarcticibacterium sp. W02-3]QCY68563.1 universal stress protein [Antarcticibacterium flavum]
MEKHILIPTDFSRNAWNALTYAIDLYKEAQVTFYFLNAYQLFHFTTDSVIEPEPGEKAYEEAKQVSELGLERLVEGLQSRTGNSRVKIKTFSLYNTVIGAVKEVLKKNDIDLIIMGTKGENNPVNAIYGSNAVNVMEKVLECPVLVVPDKDSQKDTPVNEIVFATNFKYYYKRKELAILADLAKNHKAPIRVLHIKENEEITTDQKTNKAVLEDYFEDLVCTFHTLTRVKVAKGIHSFIESRNSSMLALFSRKHGLFTHLFARSLVSEIGFHPQVPVLVLREHK